VKKLDKVDHNCKIIEETTQRIHINEVSWVEARYLFSFFFYIIISVCVHNNFEMFIYYLFLRGSLYIFFIKGRKRERLTIIKKRVEFFLHGSTPNNFLQTLFFQIEKISKFWHKGERKIKSSLALFSLSFLLFFS